MVQPRLTVSPAVQISLLAALRKQWEDYRTINQVRAPEEPAAFSIGSAHDHYHHHASVHVNVHAGSHGLATDFMNKLLAPPLIYVILGLCGICIFLAAAQIFAEEMKPCVYRVLDVFASIGYVCFVVLDNIWWAFKWCSYFTKESLLYCFKPQSCSCCGFFRLKNPLCTQPYEHRLKANHGQVPGAGPELPVFHMHGPDYTAFPTAFKEAAREQRREVAREEH